MKRILLIPVIVVLACLASCSSCAMNPEVVEIFGGEVTVPRLLSVEPSSPATVIARFSGPITVEEASVGLADSAGRVVANRSVSWVGEESNADSGGDTRERIVVFTLAERLDIGAGAVLSAVVRDGTGNSLSFSAPFLGYNDRPPRLRINEIRTGYSKPKVEFVEFLVLGAGNLAGVEIVNPMNASDPSYEFPACEVRAGEYVVYHLRSVEEGLVNETGALNASAGIDARATARDFWDTLSKSPLKPTNAILVRERKGGPILDALLCAEPGKDDWPNDAVRVAAREAVEAGAWRPDAGVPSAVSSAGVTTTRTLGRARDSSDSDTASDWAVCPTGKSSPGEANAAF